MRLGSSEHYGWERPRTVSVGGVFDGAELAGEFAWLRVPDGAKGGPLDVMVRLRTGRVEPWREPQQGERLQLQAWELGEEEAALLGLAVELDETEPWTPPKRNPDLWLWVEG